MKRFPELESLVPTQLEYIRTVRELGNDLERCKSNEVLQQVLDEVVTILNLLYFVQFIFNLC